MENENFIVRKTTRKLKIFLKVWSVLKIHMWFYFVLNLLKTCGNMQKACNIYLLVQFHIEGSFRNFTKFQGLSLILHFFPFYNAHPSSYTSSTYLVSTNWCLQDPLSSKKVLSLRKMDLEYWGMKTLSKSLFPEWLIRKDSKLRKFYFDVFFKSFLFINVRLIKEW